MKTNTCEPQNTTRFLTGDMSQIQESDYLLHLDSCGICQAQLERQAADEQQWLDVKQLLLPATDQERPDHADTAQLETDQELAVTVQQVLKSLSPTDSPDSLGRIDNFEVTGVVGSGAMGVVLKAEDLALDRIVAVKVMSPALAVSGMARTRFEREAKAAAAILHPNVIAIHGVCTTADLPYLVMPYLKGVSVQQRVDMQGPLAVPEILRVGSQIASGLAAAHQQGVIHRDIKPSNIMLDSGIEAAIITDFGLARTIDDATMTRTGVITGTPEFMSPEQARGELIDNKSDLFSLGSLLYMLCTGHAPFRAQTPFGVLRRINDDQPSPIRQCNSDIPEWLCQIVSRLQAKDPDQRPSASETHALLDGCLAHVYQPDQIPLPEPCRPSRSRQTRKLPFPVNFGVIAVLTASAFSVLFLLLPPTGLFPITNDEGGAAKSKSTSLPKSKEKPAKIFKTLQLQFPKSKEKGNLVIDINRGFVEVATHDKPGVVVEILYPPEAMMSRTPGGLKQQFAPAYDLDIIKEKNLISIDTYNQDYVLNMKVKVPARTNLSLDTYYDGYLKVKDVEGTIITHSQNCDITLENISGTAKAYSYNGDFKVSFKRVSPDAKLDFESYNGSIDLTFPREVKLSAAIYTGRGSFGSAFDLGPLDLKSMNANEIKNLSKYTLGSINGGGIPLRIESEKGVLALRKASTKD